MYSDRTIVKTAGDFTVETSDSEAQWVTIKFNKAVISLIRFEDLHDLKYAVDRVIAIVEQNKAGRS